MNFTFQEIIDNLNEGLPASDNFSFQLLRDTAVPADYVLNTILPQENRSDYHVNGASISIYATMLGQMAMDVNPPPMGAMSSRQFFERTTKLGGEMFFTEQNQRDLQEGIMRLVATGFNDGLSREQVYGTQDTMVNEQGVPNMSTANGRRLNAVLALHRTMQKSHWDTNEWLRGLALFEGEIDWTFGDIPLKVDYQIPSTHKRTRNGNDAYQGSTSKWWTDVTWAYSKLTDPVFIMNQETYQSIIDNDANKVAVTVNDGLLRELTYYDDTKLRDRRDVRYRAKIIVYNKAGFKMNAKTGVLTPVTFVPTGKIIIVGRENPDSIELLGGIVNNPDAMMRLGYTHIAPSVEGGGRSGAWSRIYTPYQKPMQLMAETVVNMLPVILNPKRLLQVTTAVS